jgi:hypothetical protein
MRRFTTALATVLLSLSSVPPARAEKLERPSITTTMQGKDLHIVVHNVTDYCGADGQTEILRTADAIRILRDRPSRGSGCFETRDLEFTVTDLKPGSYMITYERMPLLAPARPRRVASAMAVVR